MFDTDTETQDRGQVGIGTLIVFIALVLVAAIAAGVLINTAGFLQSQAEATGEESTSQVSDRINIQSVTGINTGGSGDGDIEQLEVVVSLAPGSDPVDLTDATFEYLAGSATTFTGGSAEVGIFNNVAGPSSGSLLESNDDQVVVPILLDGTGDIGTNLDAGDSAELTITTSNGGSSTTTITVPDPDGLSSGNSADEAVKL
jgi:flagellin FlaB